LPSQATRQTVSQLDITCYELVRVNQGIERCERAVIGSLRPRRKHNHWCHSTFAHIGDDFEIASLLRKEAADERLTAVHRPHRRQRLNTKGRRPVCEARAILSNDLLRRLGISTVNRRGVDVHDGATVAPSLVLAVEGGRSPGCERRDPPYWRLHNERVLIPVHESRATGNQVIARGLGSNGTASE